MARRSTKLDSPRELRIVEDMDGFMCAAIDRDESRRFQKRTLYFHLIMMVLFLTVILTVPAWLAAAANIILSAQLVSWKIRCRAHGVELSRLYTRRDPGVAELKGEAKTKGPLPLGLGQPEEPTFLPFSEMARVKWNEWSVSFHMLDGGVHELRLELTPAGDIERLARKLSDAHQRFNAGLEGSREDAERDRARLAAMVSKQRA